MDLVRRRRGTRGWALVLAGLLLVPLFLRGHQHDGTASRSCATCVATHHTPVVHAPTSMAEPPLVAASRRAFEAVPRLSSEAVRRPTGRAPPLPPVSAV